MKSVQVKTQIAGRLGSVFLPSILSGTDSEGLGDPLLKSFRTGDAMLFEV